MSKPQSPSMDDPDGPDKVEFGEQDTKNGNGKEKKKSVMPLTLLAVSFKEAALDSPSFRANTNHISEQFDALDRWIDGFTKATLRLSQEMDVLQEIVNYMVSRFVPDFVTQGLIDHDYTMLVMRRFAEAHKYYWSKIISRVKAQTAKSMDALSEFQRADLRSFKDCRRNFEAAQNRYDHVLARYAAVSKSKEASSLREDAFQVSEAKKAYTKASFDLCCITATVQNTLDSVLIDTMTDAWGLKKSSVAWADPTYQRLGVDMHRIKSWSKVMSQSMKPIEAEMLRARKEMEDQVLAKIVPTRNLDDYAQQYSTISHFVPDPESTSDEKHGWVFVKASVKPARQVWVRRWAFVKNGMFGWLVVSPTRTHVQESDKIGVLLCNVSPEPNEDRRFCFEVRTKDTTLIMQAEGLSDLKSWLQVFETSKRLVIQHDRDSDMSFAFQRVFPLIPEFASTHNTTVDHELTHNRTNSDGVLGMDPPSQEMAKKAAGLLHSSDASEIQDLMTAGKSVLTGPMSEESFSAVGPFGSALVPSPLVKTPMPTSMTKEAIVANSFITPTTMPTATTANYWGSVNWALYLKSNQLAPKLDKGGSQNPNSVVPAFDDRYPDFYPSQLRAQDAQMRAIFQTLVDNDNMDRVVMVFRAMISPNSKQELPGRCFVTPRNIYIYTHCFGFTALVKHDLASVASVEGHASTSWDTLYIVDSTGASAMCRVFLDSGRMIQKRLQYLVDLGPDDDTGLETIINKLQNMASHMPKVDEINDETVKNMLQKYLTYRPPTRDGKSHGSSEDDESGGTYLSIDLTTAMDQLVVEKQFDIPAKALFHVLFGEYSNVFKYTDTSMVKRENLAITPWSVSRSHMEREIAFDLKSNGVLSSGGQKKRVATVQRIEKMEDNLTYIVYDRRPPWELPHGDIFYLTSRMVILADPHNKNKCKFSIYSSIEWIRARTLTKSVVESLVYHHFNIECKQIVKRAVEAREKLGKRGMSVTAIRMFGKLGKANPTDGNAKNDDDQSAEPVGADPLNASYYSTPTLIYNCTIGLAVKCFATVFDLLQKLGGSLIQELTVHKLVVVALVASVLFNMLLMGRTGTAYWTERRAEKMSRDLTAGVPMQRGLYMNEIDDLIQQNGGLSQVPNSQCFEKFQSVTEVSMTAGKDKAARLFSSRIHQMRNELAVRRNRLIVSLRTLNALERESIIAEWKEWLLTEIHLCELANNENATDSLRQYCNSCIDEWKTL